MKRNMLYLFPLFFVGVMFSSEYRFFVNGELYRTLSTPSLQSVLYECYLDAAHYKGLALKDHFPIMESVEVLCVRSGNGDSQIVSRAPHRSLMGYYLVQSADDPEALLLFDGTRFYTFSSVEIKGEVSPKGSLEVWVSWEGVPELKKIIQGFSANYGIPVKVLEVPNTATKLLSMIKAGSKVPDVVMIQAEGFEELVLSKAFQNVDTSFMGLDALNGADVFKLQGKVWAVPFYGDTQLIFYRTDIIDHLPEPLSLTEMEKIAQELNHRGLMGLGWNLYSVYWFAPFQIGFGKDAIIEEDGTVIIEDPPTKDALSFLKSWVDRKIAVPLERDAMVSFFTSGKLAMILSGSYSIPGFEELGIPFEVTSYPYDSDSGRWISPMLDFKGFGITRKSREPVLSVALLEYLTGCDVQRRFCLPVKKIPASREALSFCYQSNDSLSRLFRHALETGTFVPARNTYDLYKNTMWKLIRFVFLDQMSIPEVLKKGQQIIDANLR